MKKLTFLALAITCIFSNLSAFDNKDIALFELHAAQFHIMSNQAVNPYKEDKFLSLMTVFNIAIEQTEKNKSINTLDYLVYRLYKNNTYNEFERRAYDSVLAARQALAIYNGVHENND